MNIYTLQTFFQFSDVDSNLFSDFLLAINMHEFFHFKGFIICAASCHFHLRSIQNKTKNNARLWCLNENSLMIKICNIFLRTNCYTYINFWCIIFITQIWYFKFTLKTGVTCFQLPWNKNRIIMRKIKPESIFTPTPFFLKHSYVFKTTHVNALQKWSINKGRVNYLRNIISGDTYLSILQ